MCVDQILVDQPFEGGYINPTRPLKSTQKERESTSVSDSTQQLLRIVYLLVVVLLVLQVVLVRVLVFFLLRLLFCATCESSVCDGQLPHISQLLRLIVPLEELVVNSPFCLLWPECPGDPSSTIILDVTLSSARLFACLALFLGK